MTSQKEISSFQKLIEALEPIEVDQLHSDIPANVRTELKRMKRNVSAILSFLGNGIDADSAGGPMLTVIRRECMSLHLTISKVLVLQFFRLDLVMDSQYRTLAMDQYEHLRKALCQVCQILSPQLTEQLGSAL